MSAEAIAQFISGGIGALGVCGLWIAFLVAGKLHTESEMKRADEAIKRADENFEREAAALALEKQAHAETRKALDAASARADSAVRSTELIAGALSGAAAQRSRSGDQATR